MKSIFYINLFYFRSILSNFLKLKVRDFSAAFLLIRKLSFNDLLLL